MKQYETTAARKRIQEIRNYCLSLRDLHWKDEKDFDMQGGPSSTMEALEQIQEFIDASYQMFSNPLPYLRKHFPGFRWKYYYTADLLVPDFVPFVLSLDFDYALGVQSFPDSGGIVAASEIDTSELGRRKVCFWTHKDQTNFKESQWPDDLLSHGYTFLSRLSDRHTDPWVIT